MEKLTDFLMDSIGKVEGVDTKKIAAEVANEEILNRLKINDIVVMSGNNADEKLIGIITRVNKKRIESEELEENEEQFSANTCNITMVGSFYIKLGAGKANVFEKTYYHLRLH